MLVLLLVLVLMLLSSSSVSELDSGDGVRCLLLLAALLFFLMGLSEVAARLLLPGLVESTAGFLFSLPFTLLLLSTTAGVALAGDTLLWPALAAEGLATADFGLVRFGLFAAARVVEGISAGTRWK
jgi:hypothetical protein